MSSVRNSQTSHPMCMSRFLQYTQTIEVKITGLLYYVKLWSPLQMINLILKGLLLLCKIMVSSTDIPDFKRSQRSGFFITNESNSITMLNKSNYKQWICSQQTHLQDYNKLYPFSNFTYRLQAYPSIVYKKKISYLQNLSTACLFLPHDTIHIK